MTFAGSPNVLGEKRLKTSAQYPHKLLTEHTDKPPKGWDSKSRQSKCFRGIPSRWGRKQHSSTGLSQRRSPVQAQPFKHKTKRDSIIIFFLLDIAWLRFGGYTETTENKHPGPWWCHRTYRHVWVYFQHKIYLFYCAFACMYQCVSGAYLLSTEDKRGICILGDMS